jgi:hypothetical protein
MTPAFLSLANKYLIVRPGVVLTPAIDPVILGLDVYFAEAELTSYVSSGLRSPLDQLKLIRRFAVLKSVARDFPEILSCGLTDKKFYNDRAVYSWQPAWSQLLNIGVIINPPVAAVALFDYMRDGINKKGELIQPSPHTRGTAFDLDGGEDDLDLEQRTVQMAIGEVEGLIGCLIERQNDCLHVDCHPA